jgi:hypothetical protein
MIQLATDSKRSHPGLCVPCKANKSSTNPNYCAAAEPGRRNGRRARSSTADTLRFAIQTTGWSLSATRSTATAQPFCNRYKLAITSPKTAKTAANNANAANNSLTKYSCNAPATPRNHHNHFLLLSLVFICWPSVPSTCPTCPSKQPTVHFTRHALESPVRLSNLPTCPLVSVTALPVPFDMSAKPKAMVRKTHFRL